MKRILIAATTLAAMAATHASAADEATLKRGEYLVTIMSCTDCHTPGNFGPSPDMEHKLGGASVGFLLPGLGYFYGPNLTPHEETGLGKWSEAEIVTALREGVRPDGRVLAPIMPWTAFASLTDEDAFAIAAYLKSLPAYEHAVPGPQGPDAAPPAPYQAVVLPDGTIIR